jgi:hypothetical protein
MRKIGLLVLAAMTAMLLAVGTGSAVAASPEQDCIDSGGVWAKDPPNNSCTYPGDPPGNNQGGVVKDEEVVTDIGKSGPHEEDTSCQVINNGGSHNCTTS